ncbi:MAG: hypothetical protein KC583_00565, partial [Myxococcales bacterium]|nr:hypothetical protein [Myxococcales bacterium]
MPAGRRPDGLRGKVWLIGPAGPGVDADVAALTAFFGALPGGWRLPVEPVRVNGGGCTADAVSAALRDIQGFDGLRIVWVGGHTRPNRFGAPALLTDDVDARDRTSLSMVDLWHALAESAADRPLMALVDVCQAAANPQLQSPPRHLAAFAACRRDQPAKADTRGGWFTQALVAGLTAGRRTPAALIEGIEHALARDHQGAQTPWVHIGADIAELWLAPDICPRDGRRLRAGDVLGHRYRLDERIGQGAFSRVWAAHDLESGASV